MSSTLIFLVLPVADLHKDLVEDFLPSVIHYNIRQDKILFNELVDNLCTEVPDSDLTEHDEAMIRKNSNTMLNKLNIRLNEFLPEYQRQYLGTILERNAVINAEVKNHNTVLIEIE